MSLFGLFGDLGPRPKIAKTAWICNNYDKAIGRGDKLIFGGCQIEPSEQTKVMGSMISSNGSEEEAYLHRVQQLWKTYYAWKRVLECCASVESRVAIWKATLLRSMH